MPRAPPAGPGSRRLGQHHTRGGSGASAPRRLTLCPSRPPRLRFDSDRRTGAPRDSLFQPPDCVTGVAAEPRAGASPASERKGPAHVEWLIDNAATYDAVLRAIARAQRSIWIAQLALDPD